MRTGDLRQGLAERRYLVSRWPWRALGYLAGTVLVGVAGFAVVAPLVMVGAVSSLVLIGVPLLCAVALVGVPLAKVERWRLRLVYADVPTGAHRPPGEPGARAWLRTRYREPTTWRELAYTLLLITVLWPLDALAVGLGVVIPATMLLTPWLVATARPGEQIDTADWQLGPIGDGWVSVPLGLVTLLLSCYLLGLLAAAQAALARLLLDPRELELGARIVELTRSRARLVDAFEAERRRIERDLHDGAQQRLVALSMTLGLARLDMPDGSAAELVDRAQEQAELVLADLRDLIRGVHPPVLTNRGLAAAVENLANHSPPGLPVTVDIELPGRLSPVVETTAYFVICEALANVVKHSGAQRARVTGRLVRDRLDVEIQDDGGGGATARAGTGLSGLADRVSVVNGRLTLASPPGGPTVLRLEVPCKTRDHAGS